jgi:hypothetical protein
VRIDYAFIEEVVHAMFLRKLKAGLVILIAFLGILLAGGGLAFGLRANPGPEAEPPNKGEARVAGRQERARDKPAATHPVTVSCPLRREAAPHVDYTGRLKARRAVSGTISAQAMLLTAGIASDSGLEARSSKVEMGLDLRGEWEGAFQDAEGVTLRVRYASRNGLLLARTEADVIVRVFDLEAIDEGKGRFRGMHGGQPCRGIYEWRGDHLAICYRATDSERPTAFRGGGGQEFLILHRVNPGR